MSNKRALIILNDFILTKAEDEELPLLREAITVLKENSENWIQIEDDVERVPWLELVEYMKKHG